MNPRGALARAHRLFTEPRPGTLRRDINVTRMGHNHWILDRVVRATERAATTRANLARHARAIVDAYAPSTTPPFATAIRTALRLAQTGEL